MEERQDTFPRLLLHHARVRPNAPATREKDLGIWQTWTWAEVAAEVRALACGLAAQGFKRGMHLAIIGDNRPRLYWSMVAAEAIGGVPVPMYQDAPSAEFVYVLNDGGAGNVAGFRNAHGELRPIAGSVRGLSAAGGAGPRHRNARRGRKPRARSVRGHRPPLPLLAACRCPPRESLLRAARR